VESKAIGATGKDEMDIFSHPTSFCFSSGLEDKSEDLDYKENIRVRRTPRVVHPYGQTHKLYLKNRKMET
jgi:hypothetical protein